MDRRLMLAVLSLVFVASPAFSDETPPPAAVTPSASQRFAAADTPDTPDLRRHVLPLLGRLGCNGRACHGSFQGQGGFRLSLFGYDLEADLAALTGGDKPRVDRANVLQSLILQKPTQQIAHEGGERLKPGTWQFHVLERWIAAGANGTAADAARFDRLEVSPAEILFNQPGDQAQLTVTAHWADGSREDVTALCRFRTNDESIAEIDESGKVVALQAGDTHVVAFYDNGVQPVPVLTPQSAEHGDRYPSVPAPTKIDEFVVAKLRRLGVTQSEVCTDAEFLRRASLDVCGALPLPQEIEAFLADSRPDKRQLKIDELLARPTHAAWWTTRLCDFVGNNPQQLNEQPFNGDLAARQWYAWLYQRVLENKPYDQIAAGMILAAGRQPGESYDDYCREMGRISQDPSGESFAARQTMPYFWMRRNNRKPEDMAQSFAYAFMGVRIQCAQCHKHPFDQWTKRDFDDFAAFFRPVTFGVAADARERNKEMQTALAEGGNPKPDLRKDLPGLLAQGKIVPWREVFVGPVKQQQKKKNKKNKPAETEQPEPKRMARFLEGNEVELQDGADPRQALLDWLRRDADQYFARAFVNRVWAGYFHVGIIEPADDLNRANPPSNQPLLEYLTRGFIEHQYDMKWLHREIAGSRTYQLSCSPNDSNRQDTRNFTRALPRRLPAEVAYNALLQATARSDQLAAMHTDVAELATGNASGPPNAKGRGKGNYALTIFGRPVRATNCDCERSMEPTLLQTLFLRNDGEMLGLIERTDGWLAQLGGEAKTRALGEQVAELTKRKQDRERDLAKVDAKLQELTAPPVEEAPKLEPAATETTATTESAETPPAEAAATDPATSAEADPATPNAAEEKSAKEVEREKKEEKERSKKEQARKAQEIKQVAQRGQKIRNELAQLDKQIAKLAPLAHAPPAEPLDTAAMIRQSYLRTVSRPPTEAEIARIAQYISDPDNQQTALRDVLWALLNTKEFILNH